MLRKVHTDTTNNEDVCFKKKNIGWSLICLCLSNSLYVLKQILLRIDYITCILQKFVENVKGKHG